MDLGADALYVPRPTTDPHACPITCYEGREAACTCSCGGKNHGAYLRPVAPLPPAVTIAPLAALEATYEAIATEPHTLRDCEDLILESPEAYLDALVAFLEAGLGDGLDPSEIYAQMTLILGGPIDIV